MTSHSLAARIYAWSLLGLLMTAMTISMVKTVFERAHSSEAEKRRLAAMPEIPRTLKQLESFPPRFEAFFNDCFGFRKALITIDATISTVLLGQSPTDMVIKGKDNWLFYSGEYAVALYRNTLPLSGDRLESWRRELAARQDRLASQGVGYAFVIAPDKHTIYGEYMPRYLFKTAMPSQYDQIIELAAKNNINAVDLRPYLLSGKNLGQLYYTDDSHWTGLGAYLGYEKTITSLRPGLELTAKLAPEDFVVSPRDGLGDLSQPAMLSRIEAAPAVNPDRLPCRYRVTEDRTDASGLHIFQRLRCDGVPKKLLIFGDSFAEALLPYLAQNFGEVVSVRKQPTTADLLDYTRAERPDYVIEERVERYLNYAP